MFKFIVLTCVILIGYSCQPQINSEHECLKIKPSDTLIIFVEEPGKYQFYKQEEWQRVELHFKGRSAQKDSTIYLSQTGVYDAFNLALTKSPKEHELTFSVDLCESCFNLPVHVTANGDGVNDQFLPAENYCSIQLDIEDELGVTVDTDAEHWERNYSKGLYYYVCEIKTQEGEVFVQNGRFELSH